MSYPRPALAYGNYGSKLEPLSLPLSVPWLEAGIPEGDIIACPTHFVPFRGQTGTCKTDGPARKL